MVHYITQFRRIFIKMLKKTETFGGKLKLNSFGKLSWNFHFPNIVKEKRKFILFDSLKFLCLCWKLGFPKIWSA